MEVWRQTLEICLMWFVEPLVKNQWLFFVFRLWRSVIVKTKPRNLSCALIHCYPFLLVFITIDQKGSQTYLELVKLPPQRRKIGEYFSAILSSTDKILTNHGNIKSQVEKFYNPQRLELARCHPAQAQGVVRVFMVLKFDGKFVIFYTIQYGKMGTNLRSYVTATDSRTQCRKSVY